MVRWSIMLYWGPSPPVLLIIAKIRLHWFLIALLSECDSKVRFFLLSSLMWEKNFSCNTYSYIVSEGSKVLSLSFFGALYPKSMILFLMPSTCKLLGGPWCVCLGSTCRMKGLSPFMRTDPIIGITSPFRPFPIRKGVASFESLTGDPLNFFLLISVNT